MRCLLPLVAVVCAAAGGCSRPPANGRPPAPPAPVTVAAVGRKTVPVQVRTIGSVKAVATVAVRSRVGGVLTAVHFREGDTVTKGQPLFTIDPLPYEAAVTQAKAVLAKSEAVAQGAERDRRRLEGVSTAVGAELDAARTAAASARATVAVDEAALASAKLQLTYTTITSPLDGRTGELLVNQGNLVDTNGATPLVVVNQISPITVTFALPEPQLPAVTAARRQGPLTVEAYLRDGQPPIPGALAFVDNAVNATSGTVQLKAEFPNTDRKLWPGQIVDVVLTVRREPDRVVVPAAAVQAGQTGPFVFLVTADKTAELRPVTVEFETGGEAVIASGLAGGETVVTSGQLRLVPGAAVEAKADARPEGAE